MSRIFRAGLTLSAACAATMATAEPAPAPPLAQPSAFPGGKAAPEAVLDRATAREDLGVAAQSSQAATVSRSSVSGTVDNGAVGIAGSAFQNASGVTLINANSGNNVAMNGSINVNIVIAPPQP